MTVYLYTLISESIENRPLRRSTAALLRNRARRLADLAQWAVSGRFPFAFYNYEDRENSNVGDIAIRVALSRQIAQAFAPEQVEIVEISWGDLNAEMVERINRDGDLFVVGGGYFHYGPDGNWKKPVTGDAPYLEAIRCPVVICGAGANCKLTPGWDGGPIPLGPESTSVLRRILRSAALCGVRDPYTEALFREAGRSDARTILDPAMLLKSSPVPVLPPGLRVGLNFGFHGPHSQSILANNLPVYADFLKRLRGEMLCDFYYFVHSDGERLVARLLRMSGIPLKLIEAPATEMIGYYRQMSIQLSHMMHSAILSMAAGTPVISLAYDIKNISLFRLMGVEKYAVPVHRLTADRLLEVALELLSERDSIAQHLQVRRSELASRNRRLLSEACILARSYHANCAPVSLAR